MTTTGNPDLQKLAAMLCSSGAKGSAGIRRQRSSVAVAGDPTAMLCSSGVEEVVTESSCIACSVAVLFSSEYAQHTLLLIPGTIMLL